jgi:predicted anti-sigma-YlaC factor YlaD
MSCDAAREAVSASMDGEAHYADALAGHVATCGTCRDFLEFSHALRRSRLREAPPTPDLAPRVVKQAQLMSDRFSWKAARILLGVCALEVMVFSVGDLLGESHADRHLGAFSIAFAVVLLGVVARPTRARIMLPVAGVLAIALTVSAVVDLVTGNIPLLTEARHIPEVLSVVILWMLARPAHTRDGHGLRDVAWRPTIVGRERDSA